MIVLIVYSYSIKNKLKKCPPSCNDGNCSVLPTGIYTIQAGGQSLLQANEVEFGSVYVGLTTDKVPSSVTSLSSTWHVMCLPSQSTGQSLIALFNVQPENNAINALQQTQVVYNGDNLTGSKMTTTTSDVDPTFAQWMNAIPQSSGGYQLMSAGRYLALRNSPVNSNLNFSTSLTASPDAVWDTLANFELTNDWSTIFTFSPVG
jgi:hypothetical protein